MPAIPTRSLTPHPEPTADRPYPWRFSLGDTVHALGHPELATFKVTGGELWLGWPHLHAVDDTGKAWRLPQIHCSSKPIVFRKG